MKKLSKTAMKSISGGFAPASNCSVKCKNGTVLVISSCADACSCDEQTKTCECRVKGVQIAFSSCD